MLGIWPVRSTPCRYNFQPAGRLHSPQPASIHLQPYRLHQRLSSMIKKHTSACGPLVDSVSPTNGIQRGPSESMLADPYPPFLGTSALRMQHGDTTLYRQIQQVAISGTIAGSTLVKQKNEANDPFKELHGPAPPSQKRHNGQQLFNQFMDKKRPIDSARSSIRVFTCTRARTCLISAGELFRSNHTKHL